MIKSTLRFFIDTLRNVRDKGFFHLFVSTIFVKAIGFGSQFFVAWWLTTEQIGEIKIIQTYFALASTIVLFGFNSSILKLCSEDRPIEQIVGLYKVGKKYVSISFLIFIPILIYLAYVGIVSPNPRVQLYFVIVLIGLYPNVMNECDTIFIQAMKQIKLMAFRQVLIRTISILLIIALTYFYGFNGYIAAFICSSFIAYIVFKIILNKLNAGISVKVENSFLKEHWQYSKFAVLALIVSQLGSFADVYLMNFFIDDKEMIGYYSFALLLILIPTIFSGVVQQIIVPYISSKSKNIIEIKKIYTKYQKINIISSFIITIFTLVLVPFLVMFIFGDKYTDSIPLFKILIISWFFQNIPNLRGYILLGIGLINLNFYCSIIATTVKFLVCMIAIHLYGIIGLAYGILISNIISMLLTNLAFNYGIKKRELLLLSQKNYTHEE